MAAVPLWLRIAIALAIALAIWWLGMGILRSLSSARRGGPSEPEDVEELDVYLVCGECGTEFRVTRLGELQIPRHCGEPMRVVRRPGG